MAADGEVGTPSAATVITSLPYEGVPELTAETPPATDPAGLLVAASCNAGADIYGTAWWKYTATTDATFVAHAAKAIGGPAGYEPIGTAVVSGDLASVRSCGAAEEKFTDAGLIHLTSGQSIYFVTFLTAASDNNLLAPPYLGVYPSSGVVPSNDSLADPLVIGSLPFVITQDTTLATREPFEPACYSKFGLGPSVWYSYTPTRSQLIDLDVTSDYGAEFIVMPGIDAPQNDHLCGQRQFQAEAGVTYLIGVYGMGEVRNSGQLTVRLSAAPAAPAVQITLAASGTVNKKTGAVQVTGEVTCTAGSEANAVTGTLTQVYKRVTYRQDFTGTATTCTGQPVTWAAEVVPTTFRFKGKTQVSASVTACNTGGCTTVSTQRTVKLR